MDQKCEVVIIGAGPAGLAAGKKLAENGKKVIILEKGGVIGRKVCAGGLTGKELNSIFPKSLVSRKFSRGIVHVGTKKFEIPVPELSIATCDREKLGSFLAEVAAKAGAVIKTKTEVARINQDHVTDTQGVNYFFNYLIGADGSNSLVRKSLKLTTKKIGPTLQYRIPKIFKDIEIFFDLKNLGPAYIWIFPHEKFTEIGTGSLNGSMPFKTVREYFLRWLKERRINTENALLRSAPINCDYQGFQFGKIFLTGDASGFTDAFTGEGIYPAIISGEEAARKILEPDYSLDQIQKLLLQKRKKEKPLRYYFRYPYLRIFAYRLIIILLQSKKFQKKLIRVFLE